MRLTGVDVSSWSNAKERLLRHMFILDLIRDFNRFASETIIAWCISPNRDQKTWDTIHDTIEKYKKSALYTIFTEEEKEKYKDNLVNSDAEIMKRVSQM